MLTAWAKKALLPSISDNILPAISSSGDGSKAYITSKTVGNNTAYINAFSYTHSNNSVQIRALSESENYSGIYIGSGDAPESENSYTLANVITSGCSGSAATETHYDADSNTLLFRITITISNTSAAEIVIKEIGKVIVSNTAPALGQATSTPRKQILVDRTVLTTPVTISAGEAGVIFYDFIYYDGSNEVTANAQGA